MPDIWIDSKDGRFQAYLATKRHTRGPGILLIHEMFGVNQAMRDLADDLSLLGHIVVCPDLFWRIKPGIKLGYSEAETTEALGYLEKFDVDKGVADLTATLGSMRRMVGGRGAIGAVGYGIGGLLSYLMMARSDVECGVSYYGIGVENHLDEAQKITKPFLMMMAGQDRYVPPDAQEKIRLALESHETLSLQRFVEQQHGFARIGGAEQHVDAAQIANDMTAKFLYQHLFS
jgi:carboxymethylenebutenolidase